MTGAGPAGAAAEAEVAADTERPCFVYGVVPTGTAVPNGVTGLEGGSLQVLDHGEVAAVVDAIDDERAIGTRDDLLAYSRVLDAVASVAAVAPVRFGSVLTGAVAVADELLAAHHDFFVDLLAEFEGRQQYTLRARYHQDAVLAEVVAERPDIAALRAQTRDLPEDASYYARVQLGELVADAVDQKRSVDGQQIVDALAPHAVDHRVREQSGLDDLVELALLVETEQLDGLEEAAEDLAAQLKDRARLQLRGPLAPYDFVPEEE